MVVAALVGVCLPRLGRTARGASQYVAVPAPLPRRPPQAVVLLRFNASTRLSLEAIVESTGLPLKEAKRTLQSLACGKVRVLLKHPAKGKEVKAGDVFEFNGAFTARMFRLRINAIQARETRQEAQNTNKRVARDRQYQLDAVIVRIMKTRKMLRHNELIGECMKQVPCAPVRPPWGSMRATSRARR